ncbi:MAG: Gfo/Idh/MocA family protein [Geminicoccaceae bacterium]
MGEIGVGIIGTGFMGECHALAFSAVAPVFQPKLRPRLQAVADVNAAAAERARERFGFARASADWRELVGDPSVGLVSITAPNILHKEMALAAIAAGKHVYCEKPLALTAADARELTLAAEAAGVRTMVGYNYLCSPGIRHIRKLLDEGELGRLTYLRCAFEEDYMADPATPFSWRCDRSRAGSGALGDMGSHALSLARYLGGPITEVLGDTAMVVPERAVAPPGGDLQFARIEQPAELRKVENEDIAHCLFRFANGVMGSMITSRTAWGRKNGPDLELYGTLAGVRFRQERFNEFELFRASARKDDNGFRTVYCGPYHGDYGRFTPAPGHSIGFNDLKVIEVAGLLEAIATDAPAEPDFREGWAIEAVCDAVLESVERRAWVRVPPLD